MQFDIKLAVTIVGACVLVVGGVWGMIGVHAQSPHAGTVSRDEFALLREIMSAEHAGLRAEIESVKVLIGVGVGHD